MLSFKHSGGLGDIIYALPTIHALRNADHQTVIYLRADRPSFNYDNPLSSRLTPQSIQLLKPLLEAQDYIDAVHIHNNEEVSADLDEFRCAGIDYRNGHIPRWYFHVFYVNYDLSKPWLKVEPKPGPIIVNRSKRYKNLNINYRFLCKFDIQFVGLQEEFEDFRQEVPKTTYRPVKDFLELAEIIAGAKLFIGNQSFAFSLAEALKTPRVLEVCPFAANVVPHGEKAWDVIHQISFEHIVKKCLE